MAHAYLKAGTAVQVIQRCKKIAWESRRAAFSAKNRARKDPGVTAVGVGTLHVYRCKICGGWHLGHNGRR